MDKEFEMHSALFDFIPITGRHTGDNLGELLFKSIVKGGTLNKASAQLWLLLSVLFTLFPSVTGTNNR